MQEPGGICKVDGHYGAQVLDVGGSMICWGRSSCRSRCRCGGMCYILVECGVNGHFTVVISRDVNLNLVVY